MTLHHGTEAWPWYAEKILPRHWERLAVVYVRQSTMPPGLEHQESTRLPYGRGDGPSPGAGPRPGCW
jgi:hypothetical protein